MVMKIFITVFLLSLLAINLTYAQREEKLNVKPSGRILMDAGVFDADNYSDMFNRGVAIPDVRIGFKAQYGKWKGKVDIGYAYARVSTKDIYIQYTFNKKNLIRGGYFVHQFGLQSSTSSSFKISMEEPRSNQAFFNSRLVGAMFLHSNEMFFGTLSLFAESDAMKQSSDKLGNPGYGMMSRLIFRPLRQEGKIFHIGISGAFESPRYNSDSNISHSSYVLKSDFPTRIAKVTSQKAEITDANMLYKFTPEITVAIGRIALETQYYYLTINRKKGFENYFADGAYALLRGIIKGPDYKYSDGDSGIGTPAPGSMELVLGYDYTDLSDDKSGIYGGTLNDLSLTFNYYLNKYMIWRVRGSITNVTDRAAHEDTKLSLIETRFQIKF